MDRDELVKDVARAFAEHCRQRPWLGLSVDETAAIMMNIAEPMIRADERIKVLFTASTVHRDEWADLRAQVEALRSSQQGTAFVDYQWNLAVDAVLALIDGGSDG